MRSASFVLGGALVHEFSPVLSAWVSGLDGFKSGFQNPVVGEQFFGGSSLLTCPNGFPYHLARLPPGQFLYGSEVWTLDLCQHLAGFRLQDDTDGARRIADCFHGCGYVPRNAPPTVHYIENDRGLFSQRSGRRCRSAVTSDGQK